MENNLHDSVLNMRRGINSFLFLVFIMSGIFFPLTLTSQVAYGSAATYGLRKVIPSYAGSSINVRRSCDNATMDIGFSGADLNTTALTKFTILANSLTAVSTAAVTAYGLRKLSCTYAGKGINVRRSSDNTTLDIGFTTAGDLDTASLVAFVGTNSGFVTKWYDQSGNTRDASQATAANQPRIVNAGVIDRQNGVPAIFFNNTGAGGYAIGLQTANLNIYTAAACFLAVAAVNTNLTYNALVTKTGTNGPAPAADNYPCPFDFYYSTGGGTQILVGNGNSTAYSTFTATKDFKAGVGLSIWTYQANGTNNNGVNAYYNGSTQIITNQKAAAFGDQATPVCIGARFDGATGLNGWISEILTFNAIPTAADIGFLEYTEGTYFGIAGPTYIAPSSSVNLDAYVTTWYDQSGNGQIATQATAGKQPRIVNAGVIDMQNSLASMHFDGATEYLTANAFPTAFNNTVGGTLNTIGLNNGASSLQGMAQQGRNATPWWGVWGSATGKWSGDFSNGPVNMISAVNSSALTTINLIQLPAPASSTTLYGNGTSVSTSTVNANSSNAQSFYIGYSNNASEYWNGYESELNVFALGLNTTRRTLLETNQASYYGIAVAGTTYTVANGYNLFVTGVGRTSATDSVADSRQSAGMGFIVGNTGADYLKETGDYITAGMTAPTASVTTSSYMPAGATIWYERWLNDWYINKTDVSNDGGNLKIFFDFSDYGVPGVPTNVSNYQLWGRATTTSNFTVVPTTTVTISGDRVVFTLLAASLGTTAYYTLGTIDYGNSPLPIELLSFSAVPNNNKVDLKWETATETNNAYFTIEKSKDGANFTKLIDVPGAGNSTSQKDYYESDYQPYTGTSYYRLKQTDENGNYKYYPMQSVSFSMNLKQNISFGPNPLIEANQGLNAQVDGYQNQEVLVVLRDINGREMFSKVLITVEDSKLVAIDETSNIPTGEYIIVATSNGSIYNQKIIVVRK
jgi:hypothetical protein